MGPEWRRSGLVEVGPALGPEGGIGLAPTGIEALPPPSHPCTASLGPVWHFLH